MAATPKLYPTTRTERQIQRLGIGPWALTPDAVALFARRQRLRMSFVCATTLVACMAFGVAVWDGGFADDTSTTAHDAYGHWTGLAIALYGGAVVVSTRSTGCSTVDSPPGYRPG